MHFLRFLILMQSCAPGAQVQIVISKTDRVSDKTELKSRVDWVMNEVNDYVQEISGHKISS